MWVQSWQQQCCGQRFAAGSQVQWRVVRHDAPHEWITELLGPEWASRVTFTEEHHLGDATGTLSGVVSTIDVLTCERVLDQSELSTSMGYVPVSGSGRLRRVTESDPWEPEPQSRVGRSGWSFDGWIVRLTDVRYQPGPPRDPK